MIRQLIEQTQTSQGERDAKKIQEIANAVETIEGVKLLNIDPGAINRTVITFVGEPQQVIDAAFLLIQKAQNPLI